MSQQNRKTPATVLQEFAVKHKYLLPEYILTVSKTRTHKNEFHYKVNVANVCATGVGRSKKLAKHDAASKALEILDEQGLFSEQCDKNESKDPLKHPINYIGILKNSCCKFNLPHAVFSEVSDVGPQHCRQFTYECKLGSVTTQAVAHKKKEAKQLAAKHMLDKIQSGDVGIVEQCGVKTDVLADFIIKKYNELVYTLKVPSRRVEIRDDFSITLNKMMKQKEVKFGDFREQFQNRNNENLDFIFDKLGIGYKIDLFQESPPVVCAIFTLDIPFTIMASGSTPENAKVNLIGQIYSVLDVCMSTNPDEDLENN